MNISPEIWNTLSMDEKRDYLTSDNPDEVIKNAFQANEQAMALAEPLAVG